MSSPFDSNFTEPQYLGGPATADERQWALFAHLGGLLAAGASGSSIGFLVPLVIWQMKKDQSAFVDDQAKEALNFQLSILLAGVALGAIGLLIAVLTMGVGLIVVVPLGIVAAIALGLYAVVMPIVAAIQANAGEAYRYPLTLRLIK